MGLSVGLMVEWVLIIELVKCLGGFSLGEEMFGGFLRRFWFREVEILMEELSMIEVLKNILCL